MSDADAAVSDLASADARWASVRGPLFTDLYQLVMVQLYYHQGLAERCAQFDYFYRSNPDYGSHQAGFCVTAGLGPLLAWMSRTRFEREHLDALAGVHTATGGRLFDDDFLGWLSEHGHFGGLQIDGVEEGRVVHPNLPILSVTGPLAAGQLLETALLNHLNYPTLIASKAARVAQSARGAAVLEFGMRRGPGIGVTEGIRSALIGGCDATSDVEAAVAFGADPKGTHAHSMVQAFMAVGGGELEAFRAYAEVYPDDCIFLVDTIDTLRSGVPNAITVFHELRERGHQPVGIRLDSGDLAYLGVQAAKLLDEAGFERTRIVLSGDLDELTIWQILTQMNEEAGREGLDIEAIRSRLVYGVGTRLITSDGAPALNGVYKLVGIHDADGTWVPAVKLSETPAKIPIPGRKQVWRLYDGRDIATVDLVTTHDEDPLDWTTLRVYHPYHADRSRVLRRADITHVERLHEQLFGADVEGGPDRDAVTLDDLRRRCRDDIGKLDPGVRRLVNPHEYHVSLSTRMHAVQVATIESIRGRLDDVG